MEGRRRGGRRSESDKRKRYCESTNEAATNAHAIFKWAKENHGRSAVPKWNFYKILINKEGKIENTFSSMTKPMSKKIITEIEKIL